MNSVLIIDDDKELCALMKKCVEQENLSAVVAHGGLEGLRLLEENKDACSLIILDVMMPDMDGFQVLQKIREKNNVPVLMLTAKSDEEDKVSGLRLGADDYLTKPVDFDELELRIRALLRRYGRVSKQKIQIGNTELDFMTKTLKVDSVMIDTTKKEFLLLFTLLSSTGRIFSRTQLLDEIWGSDSESLERTVDVHINKLREKLIQSDVTIISVRGLGYKAERK